MKKVFLVVLTAVTLVSTPETNFAQVAPTLGTASSFALFTATGAFNGDNATTVVGDVGTNVGAYTPPGVLVGASHVADLVSAQAAMDVANAYMSLEVDNTCGVVLNTPFGNQTLTPNVYCLGGASVLNGNLILDAGGNPNAVFIFKVGGALSTNSLSTINLINGASFCNVYFRVDGAVNLGTSSIFQGNIVAAGAIHLLTAATLIGRGLSTVGEITTAANVVQLPMACVVAAPPIITCPANVTVSCASQVPAANIASVMAASTCPGGVTVTFVSDIISNQTCANRFTITRTYRVTDACGGMVDCAQIITVNDQTAPTITCPANVSVSCAGQVPLGSNTAAATSDNCGGAVTVTFAEVISNQTCANRFIITRTYTATDVCGNFATCAQTITVNDQTAPTITCPANVTVSCTGQVPQGSNTAAATMDNCGGAVTVTFADVISNQTCANRYIITRTYTGTDVCGNFATCAQTITVNDQTPPTITCPANISVSCVPAVDPTTATANDNCGPVMITFVGDAIVNQRCANGLVFNRTYRATDACGNQATCVQAVTVNDQTAPTITCPADVTVSCTSQVPVADPASTTTSDNCGGAVTVTSADVFSNRTCDNRFTITRTYTGTDACSNASMCAQTITVNDQTAPTLTCPANVTVSCAGQVPQGSNTAATTSDNCGGAVTVTFAEVISNQTCANRFIITRTYTATDACDNIAMCAQTITVNDQTAPTITCPANVTVSCAGQVPTASITAVTTSDNCGGVVTVTFVGDVISNQTCANRFTITRTYQATDICGNVATCAQIITVFDQTPPTITCPANISVSCINEVPIGDPARIVTSDNCGGLVTVTFVSDVINTQTCPNRFTITRTYQATDVCGNIAICVQTITVNDQTPPIITCPANVTVSCANQVPTSSANAVTTSDNCGPVTVTAADVITSQTCANRFTVTRTYTSSDGCNTATCAQLITVFDNTLPIITCPANVTVTCVSLVPAPSPGTVIASDLCGGTVTVVHAGDVISSQICANRFTITRTYRATDACGNMATCTQTITVNDQTAPVITGPANVTVSCTNQLPAANPSILTTSDNCGGAVTVVFVGDVISSQICLNRYTVTRTYRATDLCGNSSTYTQIITVGDQTLPVFTVLPQNLAVECTVGYDSETALENWVAHFGFAEVNDQCGAAALTEAIFISEVPQECGGSSAIFTRTYEFRATDACGNTSSARATFSVVDHTPPVIICPPGNILLTCARDIPVPDLSTVTAYDNCGGDVKITLIVSSVGTGCIDYPMTTSYWYMATDECGNMSNCDQSFQVVDSLPPMYAGPDTIDVGCIDDLPGRSGITAVLAPYMSDNCSEVICFGGLKAQNAPNSVSYEVKAKDLCGNWGPKFTVTFIATGTCQPLCTAPQAVWGDPAGIINQTATTAVIGQSINTYGGVTAGKLGRTITATSTDCLQSMLPSNGNTPGISPGLHEFGAANNCQPSSPLLNPDGTLRNKLAANVLAMQLNIWYNLNFNNRHLGIQQLAGLPACLVDPIVVNKIGIEQASIQDLLATSNDYLAGIGFFPQNFGALLSDALDNLNLYWQNCEVNTPCSANASVAGALKTEMGVGLSDVEVGLAGAHPNGLPINMFDLTDEQGNYLFSNAISMASNLTVTPTKDDNPLNGVTTYDLALISKHILGLEPLSSPYKMIAADANKSGSITAFDIVELRKLILGIYQVLPNNTSWRFVDKSFTFTDPTNPFETVFPENKMIANIQASEINDDFVAVKIGDLNQSAIANAQQDADDRTLGTLLLDVDERTVKAGEIFDVAFKTAEANQGFQFTLKLDGLIVTEIVHSERVSAENFGVFQHALTASIDGAEGFTVRFRATKDGKISEMFSLSSEITKAEGYTTTGEREEVALRFKSPAGTTTVGVGFELYQNQPNPFVGRTSIGFHLPAAATATLTVYDGSGRTIFTQQGDFTKGYNSILVEPTVLNTPGLLYYKLQTPTNVATKKMIQSQ